METIMDDIRAGTSRQLLKEFRNRIIDTAKNIKSNEATFNISTLDLVRDRLLGLMSDYTDTIRKVEASEQAFMQTQVHLSSKDELDLNTFEEHFKTAERSSYETSNLEQDALSTLENLIVPPAPRDEEVYVEAPAERTWPKDPITKTNIRKAVRNKVCNHIYDRTSIENYIDQRKANKQRVPCPVAGCRNKNTEKKDLVPDDETNNLIESLQS
jgi:hypothetical protein